MTLPSKSDGDDFTASEFNEVQKRLIQTAVQGRRVNPTHEDYGAKGDGTADDTTAIKNAITDLRGFGGGILELNGDFRVTDQIVTQDGPNAAPIIVTGHAASPMNNSAQGPSRLLVDHDGHGLVSRGIGGNSVKHLSIIDNLSSADRTQGAGLLLSRDISGGDDGNIIYGVNDVYVKGFQDGIRSVRGVASAIEKARVDAPERDGIRLESTTGGSGTSVEIQNCFVRNSGQDNYSIGGHTYTTVRACASDSAGRHGYRSYKDESVNPAGHSYIGCGTEDVTQDGINAEGPSMTALTIFGGLHTSAGRDGIRVNTNGGIIGGVKLTSNTGYGLNNVGTNAVTDIGSHFISNTAGAVNGPIHRLAPTGNTANWVLAAGGVLEVGTGDILLTEGDKPGGRGSDSAHLYLEDDGGGKSRLVIRWGDDVDTVIATQP